MPPLPFFPTAMHLTPNGKVIFYGGDPSGDPPGSPATSLVQWDPATGQTSNLAPPGYDLFCAGHSWLADGKLLLTGGHILNFVGLPNASLYDPFEDQWTPVSNMNAGRWYPTNTTLANGDVLVVSGQIDTSQGVDALPQVYQAASGTFRDLTNAQLAQDLYPRMHLAPNGQVFNSGPSGITRYLDTSGTGNWTFVANRAAGNRDYGSAVMYDTGKILFVGGGDPPTGAAEKIDLTAGSPTWTSAGSLAFPRRHLNATLLPDGKVLVTGGTSGPGFNDMTSPVYASEMWDPTTGNWTTLASQTVGRFYHSVALLLPDGRVMSAGGNGHPEVEVFSPPYLFAGPRPTLTNAPTSVSYGQSFTVQTPDAANIAKVTWIRLPAVTHAFDQNQRINRLTFTQASGALNVTAPSDPNVTPPGHYMLFILNGAGVPSVAKIVQIGGSGAPPPPPNGPTLSSLSPSSTAAGSAAFTLTVTGTNFVNGSTVLWNGSARTTTFVSSTQLSAAITAADVSAAGSATVTVTNPSGGGTSNALTFTISGGALQVFITQPTNGSTVSGTTWVVVWLDGTTGSSTVTATLDGRTAGTATDSSRPISFPIDTTVVADGTRTLTVSARDAAGHTGTGSISVVTNNGISGGGGPLTAGFSSPANGATVSGTVTVGMTASGGTAPYTYTLRLDASQLTSGASNTFSWNTTTASQGGHTLGLTVRDNTGATATASISVTVQNGPAPLAASFTAPANGATVSGTVNVAMAASGGTAPYTYTLTINGTQASSGAANTFSWNTTAVADGNYALALTVRDNAGRTATANISVTVQNRAAGTISVFITQPANGATVSGTAWVVIWIQNAAAGTKTFTLTAAGATVGTTNDTSNGPITMPWVTTSTPNGQTTVTASVRDAANNTGSGSITVNVQNAGGGGGGGSPLAAGFTAPANGATVSGTVNVGMTASGGTAPYTYTLTINGTQASSGGSNTYAWNTTAVANGNYALALTVRDSAGASATASVTVNVQNGGGGGGGGGGGTLSVALSQPSPGATVSGTVWVTIWVSGAAAGNIAFTMTANGSTVWNETNGDRPATLPWVTTNGTNGTKTLVVNARDSAGATGSASVTVTVANP
jgi:hypothetical protein